MLSMEEIFERRSQLKSRALAIRMSGLALAVIALVLWLTGLRTVGVYGALAGVGVVILLGLGVPTQLALVRLRRLERAAEDVSVRTPWGYGR
jgi:hypothetical protein